MPPNFQAVGTSCDPLALAFAVLPSLLEAEQVLHCAMSAGGKACSQPLSHERIQHAIRCAAALVWPMAVLLAARATAAALSEPAAGDAAGDAIAADWERMRALFGSHDEALRLRATSDLEARLATLLRRLHVLHQAAAQRLPEPMQCEADGAATAMRALRLADARTALREELSAEQPPAHALAWLQRAISDAPSASASGHALRPAHDRKPSLPPLPETYHELFLRLADQPCYRCGRQSTDLLLCLLTHRCVCALVRYPHGRVQRLALQPK